MQIMQLAGRINHGASAPFYNKGEWSSTEQGEREIGASLQLNRRLSQMRALQAGGRELDRNLWQLAPNSICFWT